MADIVTRNLRGGVPWRPYVASGLAAVALKLHYSRAGVMDLTWVLAPTAALVGWLCGQPLLPDANAGWVAADGSFVIAPACAGINFLILVLLLAVLGFTRRFRSGWQRGSWMLLAASAAYLLAIAVNAVRIVVAVGLYDADVRAGWMTPEHIHRLAGTAIYLAALWGAWSAFDSLSALLRPAANVSREWNPRLILPVAYIGMTVVLPYVNGASERFGAQFLEHALTVSVIAAFAVPLLSLIRCVTSCSTRTRTDAHGQTDDSGGRG